MADIVKVQIQVPKVLITISNQVYELERRLRKSNAEQGILRSIEKIKDAIRESNLVYEDPLGQKYNETRADLDATISGQKTDNLVVVEVIKPIIKYLMPGKDGQEFAQVIQKGIVVVQNKEGI